MKNITLSLLLVILHCSFSQAQTEVVRKPLSYPTLTLFETQAWADESGYVLVRYEFSSHFDVYRLVHRERGEISSFDQNITVNEILGYTSTDEEFTIYLKGFALNKRGYFFLTFFKNGTRPPVLNFWVDKLAQGDFLFSYSAFGKLYVMREAGGKLNLVEITDYGKSRVIPFQVSKEQLKTLNFDKSYLQALYPESRATGRKGSVLCYKDSIVVIGEGKVSVESFKKTSRITKFDLTNGMMTQRQVPSPISGSIASKILKDRFYQLRFGTDMIGLGVYEYPSLKLVKELKYADGENIAVKTSPLLLEGGKNKEDKWADEKKDRKVMNELLKGDPQLSIQHDADLTKMLIESHIVVSYTNYSGAGSPGAGAYSTSSDYLVGFDACFNPDGTPCQSDLPKTVYYQAAESANKINDADRFDAVYAIENSSYVYNIHVNSKSKEYFVEEFKK